MAKSIPVYTTSDIYQTISMKNTSEKSILLSISFYFYIIKTTYDRFLFKIDLFFSLLHIKILHYKTI
jgi:hypothetical protein